MTKAILDVRKSNYDFELICCGKHMKVYRRQTGMVWDRCRFKCEKCGKKMLFEHWHYEAYNPDEHERKELGAKREPRHTRFRIEEIR